MTLEKRTILAREIMSSPVITITREASIADAAKLMLERNIGALPVTDSDGTYMGMITEHQLLPEERGVPFMRGTVLRLLGEAVGDMELIEETISSVREKKVAEVMDRHFPRARPDTHMASIAESMITSKRAHVVILDRKKPVGMISRHDLLRAFLDS